MQRDPVLVCHVNLNTELICFVWFGYFYPSGRNISPNHQPCGYDSSFSRALLLKTDVFLLLHTLQWASLLASRMQMHQLRWVLLLSWAGMSSLLLLHQHGLYTADRGWLTGVMEGSLICALENMSWRITMNKVSFQHCDRRFCFTCGVFHCSYVMLLKSITKATVLLPYSPAYNDGNHLSEQAQRTFVAEAFYDSMTPQDRVWRQQESPKTQGFRVRWASQSHQLEMKCCHVFALKRGLPGSLQAGNCPITTAFARRAVPGWVPSLRDEGKRNCRRTGYNTEKRNRYDWRNLRPGRKQQTEEKAEISYPVANAILEQKSFKCAWRVSFEQSVPLSPPFCVGNVLTTFITKENDNETQFRDRVSMERAMCHMRMDKTCWVMKFPGVFAGLSSETFCLRCMHHSPGILKHSEEMPLLFLRQGKRGTVLLANTRSWKRLSVIMRHTVVPKIFFISLSKTTVKLLK